MRVLLVEDNSFNGYCLQRLLETAIANIKVSVVQNSAAAIAAVEKQVPDLIILDGDLGISDGLNCNGPALADTLWKQHPHIQIIAWTDSDNMQQAFSSVFKQHGKPFNSYSAWTKVVSQEKIRKSLRYYCGQFVRFNDLACKIADDSAYLSALG